MGRKYRSGFLGEKGVCDGPGAKSLRSVMNIGGREWKESRMEAG